MKLSEFLLHFDFFQTPPIHMQYQARTYLQIHDLLLSWRDQLSLVLRVMVPASTQSSTTMLLCIRLHPSLQFWPEVAD